MGALDALPWWPFPIPALGRARLRVDGSRGRRALVRPMARGSRSRGGRLRNRGAVLAPGNLVWRGDLYCLRGAPSGTGLEDGSLRRLRPRMGPAGGFEERARVQRDFGA